MKTNSRRPATPKLEMHLSNFSKDTILGQETNTRYKILQYFNFCPWKDPGKYLSLSEREGRKKRAICEACLLKASRRPSSRLRDFPAPYTLERSATQGLPPEPPDEDHSQTQCGMLSTGLPQIRTLWIQLELPLASNRSFRAL